MDIDEVGEDWYWDALYWGKLLGYYSYDDLMKFVYAQCEKVDNVDGPLLSVAMSSDVYSLDMNAVKAMTKNESCSILYFIYRVLDKIVACTDVTGGGVFEKCDELIGDIIALGLKGYCDMDRHNDLADAWGLLRPLDGYNSTSGLFQHEIDSVFEELASEFSRRYRLAYGA